MQHLYIISRLGAIFIYSVNIRNEHRKDDDNFHRMDDYKRIGGRHHPAPVSPTEFIRTALATRRQTSPSTMKFFVSDLNIIPVLN